MRGHTLPNYWYLVKCKRPKGFKAISTRIKRVLIKVEHNKDRTRVREKVRVRWKDLDEITA